MPNHHRRAYATYARPNSAGRHVRYQTWWGGFATPQGPVDIELVSPAPEQSPEPGMPGGDHWERPVRYRVRRTGEGAEGWRPFLHYGNERETWGTLAARVAYPEQGVTRGH